MMTGQTRVAWSLRVVSRSLKSSASFSEATTQLLELHILICV